MQFPNRSIATAGVGLACALVLLVVLSWPALFGATTASNLTAQPMYTSNSATTVYETSVSTSKITSTVSTATVVATAVASMSTTAASSTVANSSNSIISGAGDTMTSIVSEGATTVASSTVMSSADVQSNPLAQPLFAFNYGPVSGNASSRTGLSAFLMLAIISTVSLVIAVSSMLFMKRRMNSEKS